MSPSFHGHFWRKYEVSSEKMRFLWLQDGSQRSKGLFFTVWKLNHFSITWILRGINCWWIWEKRAFCQVNGANRFTWILLHVLWGSWKISKFPHCAMAFNWLSECQQVNTKGNLQQKFSKQYIWMEVGGYWIKWIQ